MKIKISESTKEKIVKALDKVQARSTSRNIDISDILKLAENAEKGLEELSLPKKYRVGISAVNLYHLPLSYRGGEYTCVTIQRFATGWFIIRLERAGCGHEAYGGGGSNKFWFTKEAKEYLSQKYIESVTYL